MAPNGGLPSALRKYTREAKSLVSMEKGPPDECFKLDGGQTVENPAKGSQSLLRKMNIEPRMGASGIEHNVTALRAWATVKGRTEFLIEHNVEGIPAFANPGTAGYDVWECFKEGKLKPLLLVLKEKASDKREAKEAKEKAAKEKAAKEELINMTAQAIRDAVKDAPPEDPIPMPVLPPLVPGNSSFSFASSTSGASIPMIAEAPSPDRVVPAAAPMPATVNELKRKCDDSGDSPLPPPVNRGISQLSDASDDSLAINAADQWFSNLFSDVVAESPDPASPLPSQAASSAASPVPDAGQYRSLSAELHDPPARYRSLSVEAIPPPESDKPRRVAALHEKLALLQQRWPTNGRLADACDHMKALLNGDFDDFDEDEEDEEDDPL